MPPRPAAGRTLSAISSPRWPRSRIDISLESFLLECSCPAQSRRGGEGSEGVFPMANKWLTTAAMAVGLLAVPGVANAESQWRLFGGMTSPEDVSGDFYGYD